MKKANILSNMETASSGIKTQQSGKIVKRRQPSGGKPGKKCTISDRFNYRDPDLPIDCEDLTDSSATSGLGRKGATKNISRSKSEAKTQNSQPTVYDPKRKEVPAPGLIPYSKTKEKAIQSKEITSGSKWKAKGAQKTFQNTEPEASVNGEKISTAASRKKRTSASNAAQSIKTTESGSVAADNKTKKTSSRAEKTTSVSGLADSEKSTVQKKRGRKPGGTRNNSLTAETLPGAVNKKESVSGKNTVAKAEKTPGKSEKDKKPENINLFNIISTSGSADEGRKEGADRDPSEPPLPDKAVVTESNGAVIKTIVIAGQIEGHTLLPQGQKATRYEELIPQLVEIEESEKIGGLLIILNTVGGDVEAGLALSELIAGMKKPTVSLVLGGGHSIGIPLAVSAKHSFIVPSATMTLHPVRITGMVLSAPQTYVYMNSMQKRIINFTCSHCSMTPRRFSTLMLGREELSTDLGTVLDGKRAVKEGLIDSLGSLSDAIDCLMAMLKKTPENN